MAILRLEHGKTPSTPASSGGSSLFGGLGSFVDSTVKFLVTGADAPAAPVKKPDSSSDRSAAPQPAVAASTSGPKVTFFNPHAGRQQIAQQLHQQPAQHVQPKPVSTNDVTEHNQARAAPETAAPPASPPPKLDRSSSDPVKSDAAKGATVSPGGEKQKGKSGWGIGSFIGGIVSKVLPASKGVEVDLGEESTMYYNEKLGRYVERGKEDEAAASANVAPPPVVAAWSQPAPAVASHPQPGPSEDNTLKMPGVGAPNAADAPSMSAPAVPQLSSGPPMPTGAARVAAPPSSSALGKSRCTPLPRLSPLIFSRCGCFARTSNWFLWWILFLNVFPTLSDCAPLHAPQLLWFRYAVAGVAVTPASAPASSSPAPAARPRCAAPCCFPR